MAVATVPPIEGETMQCAYCQNPMIFRDGAWRWHQEGRHDHQA